MSSEAKSQFKLITANYESQSLQCTMANIKIHTLGDITILDQDNSKIQNVLKFYYIIANQMVWLVAPEVKLSIYKRKLKNVRIILFKTRAKQSSLESSFARQTFPE